MDIKDWGNENAKSGIFYIKTKVSNSIKVFCDMETDNGGWTMFLQYSHSPGEVLNLNPNVRYFNIL